MKQIRHYTILILNNKLANCFPITCFTISFNGNDFVIMYKHRFTSGLSKGDLIKTQLPKSILKYL